MRTVHALFLSAGLLLPVLSPASGRAETLTQALASAYSSNPEINSARAATRGVDEGVPLAKSQYRPTVGLDLTVTSRGSQTDPTSFGSLPGYHTRTTGAAGITVQQALFRGFRTRNAVRQAEADVRASRQLQQNTVQNVLFDAAQAYMDVLRDTAILNVRHQNVAFLQEQVRAAGDRFNVGENTRTDVAQARAALSLANAQVCLAEAQLAASRASYRRFIGRDPVRLGPGTVPADLIPPSLGQAIDAGEASHPAILAAVYQADSDAFVVKQVEGELLPTVSLQASAERDLGINYTGRTDDVTVVGQVQVPLYQGGAVAARVRQAKELVGQRKIEIDLNRDQVRAAIVSAWGQLDASVGEISAARAQVEASQIALGGVQEEQAVGQRTTLDVLNSQQDLLSAQINLISAEHDRVVASYSLISAMGRLSAEELRLPVDLYHPEQHYQAVKDKWHGLRTPDGR